MLIIYCDESGYSGRENTDPNQPFHLAVAVAVSELSWIRTRNLFIDAVSQFLPGVISKTSCLPSNPEFEIHTSDLWAGNKPFNDLDRTERGDLIRSLCEIVKTQNLHVVVGGCEKEVLASWSGPDGDRMREAGAQHVANGAMFVMARRLCLSAGHLGVVISDKLSEPGAESEVRTRFRGGRHRAAEITNEDIMTLVTDGALFLDSKESYHLQIVDTVGWLLNRFATRRGKIEPELEGAVEALRGSKVKILVRPPGKVPRDFFDWVGSHA